VPSNRGPGKLCYIGIPAIDIARSAEFCRRAFGWRIRQRGDGATSFGGSVNQVSGTVSGSTSWLGSELGWVEQGQFISRRRLPELLPLVELGPGDLNACTFGVTTFEAESVAQLLGVLWVR
jgi:hypothetical protein